MILIAPVLITLLVGILLLPLRYTSSLPQISNTFLGSLVIISVSLAIMIQIRLTGEFRISDGIEYAASARSFVEEKGVTIELNGARYPSRFTPWFSTIFLSPFSLLSPDLRLGGLGILLLSLISLWYTRNLGHLIGGTVGGTVALLALVINSGFLYFTGNIMTEIPVFCLLTIQLLMWLRGPETLPLALLTGILTALTTGIRPTALSTIPLHLWKFKKSPSKLFLILLPSIILMVGNLTYNYTVFGDTFRSGYHTWMSIPYDYFNLTFNIKNISSNLKYASEICQVLTILTTITIAILTGTKRTGNFIIMNREFVQSAIFVVVSALPVIAFYLPYFYGTQRFFWPYQQLATVLIASYIGLYFQAKYQSTAAYITIIVALIQIRLSLQTSCPLQRLLASSNGIPIERTIVSNINPLIIQEKFPRNRILPVDRNVEYASKCFTAHKTGLQIDESITPLSHRNEKLLLAGAIDVYPMVWNELLEPEATDFIFLTLEESGKKPPQTP